MIERLESNNGELCSNLYFLGKRTTIKTSEGIRVVALGGVIDPSLTVAASKDKYTPLSSVGDANTLKGANTADILITYPWPDNVRKGSKVDFPATTTTQPEPQAADAAPIPTLSSHPSIAELTARLKPRYHFSTSPIFYEREPYFHPPSPDSQENNPGGYAITRFISLAPFGNPTKQKWIYAFTLDPTASAPLTVPAGTTASPFAFLLDKKRALPSQSQSFSRFATDTGASQPRYHSKGANKRQKHDRGPPPDPSSCFFCLSNPSLDTNLVVSIGSDAYLTTAKGPLPTSGTFAKSFSKSASTSPLNAEDTDPSTASPTTPCPLHILIIPLPHVPTLTRHHLSPPSTLTSTLAEMHRYRHALNAMLASKAHTRLGSATWEVSRAGGVHAHWQFCPVDAAMVRKGVVEAGFRVEGENGGLPGFRVGGRGVGYENGDAVDDGDEEGDGKQQRKETMQKEEEEDQTDFFRVWLWAPAPSGTGQASTIPTPSYNKTLTMPLPAPGSSDVRFDLQFGRRVLAKLLGLEKRSHWRECAQTEAEEVEDATGFKEMFVAWDFTLGGGEGEGEGEGGS